MDFNIHINVSSSPNNLIEVYDGSVFTNNTLLVKLHQISACRTEWGGKSDRIYMDNDCSIIPSRINVTYLSYSECKFYTIETQLSKQEIESFINRFGTDVNLLIGMAPLGKVAVWVQNFKKAVIANWLQGEEQNISMDEFSPLDPDLDLSEYCESYNKQFYSSDEIKKQTHSLNFFLFDSYMKQFTYRYLALFEKWKKDDEEWEKYVENENVPIFDFIEESLYDGTHDKLHDGGLMKYHQAGKPKKLRVEWHIGKSEYSAYFWFEDERIREVFDRFYGAHPDTKTDFIIRIDAEKRKYELALYRYGLKEPQVIPEDVYQLLVFKNKFEDYRSENYNQERGAWIW